MIKPWKMMCPFKNLRSSFITLLLACGFNFSLLSCSFYNRRIMTMETFQEVDVGTTELDLRKKYGDPINTYHKTNGLTIYEYSERFTLGPLEQRVVEERRYYFYIRDGVVTSKRMIIRNPPPFEPMDDVNPDDL